ncbi:MAG: carbonic anhydrase [Chlamydiae bacterium]|jgi:carbonic anhydrase|nr:carbonic anhydrase [Chlamydiota bacterium]
MRQVYLFFLLATLYGANPESKLTPTEALNKLMAGNKRVIEERMEHPNRFQESKMQNLLEKQEPFAVIVACSDSRVSPEILFDQGIGDLFVVRVAGNVVKEIELESIHYAVSQLKTPIILVMGHENCGAVNAVLHQMDQTIPEIAALIRPAIEASKNKKGDPLQNAVEANVELVVEELKQKPFIKELVEKNQLLVKGSYYHLQDGSIRLLETH